jgi:hypothetical protein
VGAARERRPRPHRRSRRITPSSIGAHGRRRHDQDREPEGVERGIRIGALSSSAIRDQRPAGLMLGDGRLHESRIASAVAALAPIVREPLDA